MADTDSPGSPPWWRDRLLKQLDDRAKAVAVLTKYYEDGGPLPPRPPGLDGEQARAEYDRLCRLSVANWMGVIADAPASRLTVVGFRFGEQTTGDGDVWSIWQRNQLDADSGLTHTEALKTGQAFALVWDDGTGKAEITVEDPSQMIVAYEPGSRRRRAAALKRWRSEDTVYAVLYLPDGIYKWSAPASKSDLASRPSQPWRPWQPPSDDSWPVNNPLRKVPVVELRANPRLAPAEFGGGRSEFAGVTADQDRVNKSLFDRLVTQEYMGFPQRWIKGWDYPRTPDGQVDKQAMLKVSQSRVWTFQDEEVAVGQFSAADFTAFIRAVEFDIATMAATTFTPPYYHPFGDMVNISAESIKAIEAGFIAKCEAHSLNFGEGWEEVIRLALEVEGDSRSEDLSSQVIWRDIENRTWAQTVDAVLKMKDLGVPERALWEMLPRFTPQDGARWEAMRAQDALFGALQALPTTSEPSAPVPEDEAEAAEDA